MPAAKWQLPEQFEEYRLLWLLGRGGMGEVYLGHDTMLDRPVAIKFISASRIDAEMREQFLTEARAAARLQHPNVVMVYRVGELDHRPYIISEFVRGQPLDRCQLPLPWQRVLELAIGLSRGLAAAHRRGVLHRDIKPGNVIMTEEGEVKLLDFGLAKLLEAGVSKQVISDDPHMLRQEMSAPTLDGKTAGRQAPAPELATPDEASAPTQTAPVQRVPLPLQTDLEFPSDSESPSDPGKSSGIKGTPLYMAPEVLCGEPASRRSDVYSLGAVLYELCVGFPPHFSPRASVGNIFKAVTTTDAPSLTGLEPKLEPRLARVIGRCICRHPSDRFSCGEELRDALEGLANATEKETVPTGNPYRGLLPFEAEHRSLFFGRRSEIGTLVDRLRTEAFVLVAADSGVGKSSLCRAGVLPLLTEGALGGSRSWLQVALVPGPHPLTALVSALSPVLGCEEEKLLTELRKEPTSLLRRLHKQLGTRDGLLIFVDQMEELLTIGDRDESALVGEALSALQGRVSSIRLLATVRSDFLARLASVPFLGDEVSRALYILRPLSPDKLREVIVGPARKLGVSFDNDALIEQLADSTAKMEGGLPLLQFALAELWEARIGEVVTTQALNSIGGVAGALARHADHVLGRLTEAERRSARRILINLVTLAGTRARRAEAELVREGVAAKRALEALVRGRLLVAGMSPEGAVFEVAHEALINGWGTLARWLKEDAVSRAVKQRLESSTAEWLRHERSKDLLWAARQVAETTMLHPGDIGPREAEFLAASRNRTRQCQRNRRVLLASLPVLLGALYGTVELLAERGLERQVRSQMREGEALFLKARELKNRTDKERSEAYSLFDQMKREEGEQTWARAVLKFQEIDRLYVDATLKLESALSLGLLQDAVRARLVEALYDRAVAAELDRKDDTLRELLQRLALYDPTGQWKRRWNMPAYLSIQTVPAGAQVMIEKYADESTGQRRAKDPVRLGPAPIVGHELTRGSYLVTLQLPGRVVVKYPVLIERGEKLYLSIPLPERKRIPAGFVFVPPGRFLFGASGDNEHRQKFVNTVPIHPVSTGGYLIAANETAYGEYIEFLNTVPVDQRKELLPNAGSGGLNGMVALTETADSGWQLSFQPGAIAQTVHMTTRYVYSARKERSRNDWLRFPVGGINRAAAEAYAQWLSRSGRVPGARLCTELEWERAARGADDRVYPMGNVLDPQAANYDESYGKRPAAMGPDMVGTHPDSISPFGVHDLAGNVWEWVVSSLDKDESVGRSGSYSFDALTARSVNRSSIDATFRQADLGIRICASHDS